MALPRTDVVRQEARFRLEALEPRLLMSGDGLPNPGAPIASEPGETAIEVSISAAALDQLTSAPDAFESAFEGVLSDAAPESDHTLTENSLDSPPSPGPEPAPEPDPVDGTSSVANTTRVENTPPAVPEPEGATDASLALPGPSPSTGTSSAASQLTETLRAANGPPGASLGDPRVRVEGNTIVLEDGLGWGGAGFPGYSLLNQGGVVRPGFSPGISNYVDFTQGAEGKTEIEITGWNTNNSPVVYDQVVASGNVFLDGTLQILWPGDPSFVPTAGQTFKVLKWQGVRQGEFARYLGTAVPDNTQLALVPEYDDVQKELRMRVVDTESVAVEVERALRDVSELIGNLINIGPSTTDLPLVGGAIRDLLAAKSDFENTVKSELDALINGLTTQAQVTAELEGLAGETFANLKVYVDSVLGHYSDPANPAFPAYSWDVRLTIEETELTQLLADGLNAAFDFLFGPQSKVTLKNTVELDFSFGRDDTFNVFVDLREMTFRTVAAAADLDPLSLLPPWIPAASPVQVGVTGTVIFEAWVTAKPDPGLFPSGHWLATNPMALPALSNFQLTKGSEVDATLVLDASVQDPNAMWAPFALFDYTGTHTIHIVDLDLFDAVDPDATLTVDGILNVLGQQVDGVFTFFKAGGVDEVRATVDIQNLELKVTAGVGPALRILKATGEGDFLLKKNGTQWDLAGVATLDIPPGGGPELPNIDDLSGAFTLTFNLANVPMNVPRSDGTSTAIPGSGPYYRIEGDATLDLGIPDLVLSGQFVFEPYDPDNNPNNGNEVVSVGFNNLAFTLNGPGGGPLLTLSNGQGAFVFTRVNAKAGMAGVIQTANVALAIPGIQLTGTFSGAINDFDTDFSQTVTVLGTPVPVTVPAGPYLRVTALGAQLTLLGEFLGNALQASGDFSFEQTETAEGDKTVLIGFRNVNLPFVDGGLQQVLLLQNLTGALVTTADGLAGELEVGNFQLGLPAVVGLTPTPQTQVRLRVNTSSTAVSQTVTALGQPLAINVPGGPYIQFLALRMNLSVANFDVLTGDFAFEQRQSESGAEVVTVAARDLDFNLGAAQTIFDLRDGQGLFVINNGQFSGAAQVVADVVSVPFLVIDDGDPAPGIKLGFNFNTGAATAIDDVFDFGTPAPASGDGSGLLAARGAGLAGGGGGSGFDPLSGLVPVSVPAGQHFEVSAPLELSFNVAGGTQKLGGVFTFSEVNSGGQHFLGVKGTDLRLELNAGSLPVISFRDGVGQFAIYNDGLGGVATLEFESGMVGVTGDIAMELNTRNGALVATQGGYSINLTQPNYLRVVVDGAIQVGPGAFPFDFTVLSNFATQEVIFSATGSPPGQFLVKVESDGDIILGNLPALPGFSQISEGEFLPMIKQFINWLGSFRESSVYDIAVPFSGGTTLGDLFDYTHWFVHEVYPEIASIELRSVAAFRDANGNPLAQGQLPLAGVLPAFTMQLAIGSAGAVTVSVPAGGFASAAALASHLNTALNNDADTTGKVVARLNKDGQPVLALSDTQSPLHSTLVLTFTGSNHPLTALGFSNDQRAIEVERAAIGDMIQALGQALGLSPPPAYDPNSKMVTLPVAISQTLPLFNLPLDFGQSLGLIADASLNGNLSASVDLTMGLTLGFDFTAFEVPMVLTSPLVPAPSNGRLSANAQFFLFLNGSTTPIQIDLNAAATSGFTSVEQLAAYISGQFVGKTFQGQPLEDLIIVRKASTGLVVMALQEDIDRDGHFDTVNEDTVVANGEFDAGETDLDGDGRVDKGLEDLNADGSFNNQLGIINLIELLVRSDNPAATELGFGTEAVSLTGFNYLYSAAKSSLKGLFIDHAELGATLTVNGSATGTLRIGFIEVNVLAGSGFSTTPAIEMTVEIRNTETGQTRFYIPELMHGLSALDELIAPPTLTGGFSAQLKLGSTLVVLPVTAAIGVFVPDLRDLTFSAEPFAPGKTGVFLTYTGLNGIEQFADFGFFQLLQALRVVVDTLSTFESFAFLDEEIPFIEISLADMLDWAAKVGDVVDGVAQGNPKSLQKMIDAFQVEIEKLFHIDGRNQNIFKISVEDVPNPVAAVNAGNVEAFFNPAGSNNGLRFASAGTTLAGSLVRIVGSSVASGGQAVAAWDGAAKVLTIQIDPGVTTAAAILGSVNGLGSPWTASLTEGGGQGRVSRTAIKVHLAFTTGYGHTIPLQFNIRDLLGRLVGDNSAAAAFLEQATDLITIQGDGELSVGASAGVTLDFGIDLTNPAELRAFFYDTTQAALKLEVIGTGLEFEASLGSLIGIFVRDGTVTLDADGDPDTQGKAEISVGFKDDNGDGRHYFSESLFTSQSFGISARAGLTADLPIYSPTESQPLGGEEDANGDNYPDNHLVVDIPDLVRLFFPDQAAGAGVTMAFRGNHNDFTISTSDAAKHGFTVVLVHNPAVAPQATYSAGSKQLTLTINSGITTAQQIRTAINGVPTFTTAATADDDGNPATSTNNGSGKVAKTTFATPDFTQLFANMDLCSVLDTHAGLILDGLDRLLGFIQDGLESAVSAVDLPLIGDALGGTAGFIEDFREGLLADLRTAVAANKGSATETVKNALRQVFWNVLGPPGADLLVDPVTGEPLQSYQQIDVELDCDNGLEVNLRLHKALFKFDTGDALSIDLGVPGFGLAIDGSLEVEVVFDFKFGFGFSKQDGFYLVTSATPNLGAVNIDDLDASAMSTSAELFFGFSVTPKLAGSAELFFLQLDVLDKGSYFRGGFEVDLDDPNHDGKLSFAELSSPGLKFDKVLKPNLGAVANVDLGAIVSFGGNASFPRVLADFHLDWSWTLAGGSDGPHLSFDEIYLDLGTYISEFLGPVLSELRKITEPIDPIIDMVTTPLPVLSDLAGEAITFLDLAEGFGYLDAGTVKFIKVLGEVVDLIQLVGNFNGQSLLIPMGAFEMIAGLGNETPRINPTGKLFSNFEKDLESIQNANPGTGGTEVNETVGFVGELDASVFHIPIFDNPAELFGIFTGQPVRLIEVVLPTFKFEFTYVQRIPIYGPLFARFGGGVGAEISFGFGYDTYGIQKYIASEDKNIADIFDGFYIIDFDAEGNERPEVKLWGEIFAGVSINLGVAEAGVEGGVRVVVEFDLNDFNDDGRVRISELIALAEIDPLALFNVSGRVELFLRAFLTVNLLIFSIDAEWEFGRFVLFDFEFTAQLPEVASLAGSTLTLHLGDDAAKRLALDTTDGAERFIVKHITDEPAGESVEVNWEGFVEEYKGVKKIVVVNAGKGNDYLDLRGVKAEVDLKLGPGHDTVYLGDGPGKIDGGDGDDTIIGGTTGLTIRGGSGQDVIIVYGAAVVFGDAGADEITGSPEPDELHGGDGSDLIIGGADNDKLYGDGGNDVLDAGGGDDLVYGGDGADELIGADGFDVLYGENGDDLLLGGSGNDVLIGGNGNDQLRGHSGVDLLVGSTVESWSPKPLPDEPLAGVSLIGIGAHDEPAQSDDDSLIGGGSYDFLFGGRGNDFLFGGNYYQGGESEVIEEDDNDFADGGGDEDQVFGDDSQGKTGDRDTGIAVQSVVWLDLNNNSLRDEGENGVGGVTVRLYSTTVPLSESLIDTVVTKPDGSFKFTGLDPDSYFLVFQSPYDEGTSKGLRLVAPDAGENEALDSDADITKPELALVGLPMNKPHIGASEVFTLAVNQTLTTVNAGVRGHVVLSIAEGAEREGDNGKQPLTFTLNLSLAASQPISVRLRSVDATAKAGEDFEGVDTTLTFEVGEKVKTFAVTLRGDTTYEGRSEQFLLRVEDLTGPADVYFSNGSKTTPIEALGTIIGDDGPPELSVSDSVPEQRGSQPASETTPAKFYVRLSHPSYEPVSVQYLTVDAAAFEAIGALNYATTNVDYLAEAGAVVFAPGEIEKEIDVTLLPDGLDEHDERFYVQLFNAQKALIADGRGIGIIADDDAPVGVRLVPVTPSVDAHTTTVVEGQLALFRVELTAPSGKEVTVSYASSQGTAVTALPLEVLLLTNQRPDYISAPDPSLESEEQQIRFAPGETQKVLGVWTRDQDVFVEAQEALFLNLLTAESGTIAQNHGVILVNDNDGGPTGTSAISFAQTNFYVTEGDNFADITLVRSAGAGAATAVFFTHDLTATSGEDYQGGAYVVSFAPNEVTKTVQIPVYDDDKWEPTEKVQLSLRGYTGKPASAAPYLAVLHIKDNELLPVVNVTTPSVKGTEGAGAKLTFFVRSSQQTAGIRVFYQVYSLTATAGLDYAAPPAGAFVDIPYGPDIDPVAKIEIPILNDALIEAPETLGLVLTGATHATIGAAKGTGVIRDNDLETFESYVFLDSNGNGFFDFNEKGLKDVVVVVTDTDTGSLFSLALTDATGKYTAQAALGPVTVTVLESSLSQKHPAQPFQKFLGGLELTTGNDVQTLEYRGGGGIELFEAVGYRAKRLMLGNITEPQPVGRGGTDDTLFGGPGDDFIDAGAGDDHVVGGHWQNATNMNAPINQGKYNAAIQALLPESSPDYLWLRPLNGLIFDVNTAGMGNNATVGGSVFIKTPANLIFPYAGMVVNLLDFKGNVTDTVVTTNQAAANYRFTGVFPGDYVLEFLVPAGYSATPNIDPDNFRSTVFTVAASAADPDAGMNITIQAGTPAPPSSEVTFHKATYTVDQDAEDTFALVKLVRGDATRRMAVVLETVPLSGDPEAAIPDVHYTPVQTTVHFDVGQYERIVAVPVLADGPIAACQKVVLELVLRSATGRPMGDARLAILGIVGALSDDDTIRGGDDWDLILGDSGMIPKHLHPGRFLQPAPDDPNPPPVLNPYAEITFSGGPGNDSINAGRNIDRVFGQAGDDFIDGHYGTDILDAGLGDDFVAVNYGNDIVDGAHGRDTLEGTRDADIQVSKGTGTGGADVMFFDLPGTNFDTTVTFKEIEHVRLVGGVADNVFTLTNWPGTAEVIGFLGADLLVVDQDTDMTLKDGVGETLTDASAVAKYLVPAISTKATLVSQADKVALLTQSTSAPFGGYIGLNATKNAFQFAAAAKYVNLESRASLTLGNGSLYTMTGVESSKLIGGPGANKLVASGYSGDVTFQGKGGDDTMIGGAGDDTFLFTSADTGKDTVRGNGGPLPAEDEPGFDTLDFTALTQSLTVRLFLLNTAQQLWTAGPLSLVFTAEDLDAVLGGSGHDLLVGNARDNTLLGGPGNDTLEGREGNETYTFDADLVWGTETVNEDPTDLVGRDRLDFSPTDNIDVIVDLEQTTPQPIGGLTLIIAAGGFEEVRGGSRNDQLRGSAGSNTLLGGPGHDLLIGREGDDVLVGGTGNDTLVGGAGTDTLEDTANANFTLDDANLVKSNGEIDVLDATSANRIEMAHLVGGSGPNVFNLTGWTGDARLEGAGHDGDRFVFAAPGDYGFADLGADDLLIERDAPVTDGVADQSFELVDVEMVVIAGGDSDDTFDASGLTFDGDGNPRAFLTLEGGAGQDELRGSPWGDTLRGGGDNDTLRGGAGNDSLEGGAGDDEVRITHDAELFLLLPNAVVIDESLATDDSEMDLLAGIESVVIEGGPSNNLFDVTHWTSGKVTVDGLGQVSSDFLRAAGEGDFQVTNTGITVSGGSGDISAVNIEAVHLQGGPGNNTLDASQYSGLAVLEGLGGDDTLIAGPGSHLLNGGDGNDTLVSGSGATFFQGGDGDDRYVFDADAPLGADQLNDTDGNDTLDFASTTTLAVGVNLGSNVAQAVNANLTLTLLAPVIENVIGGALGDLLVGNSLANQLEGGEGTDTLRGLDGNDRLIGGGGNDQLEGGSGNDVYLFDVDLALGRDILFETDGTDTLDFSLTTTQAIAINLGLVIEQVVHTTNLRLQLFVPNRLERVIGGSLGDTITGDTGLVNFLTGGPGNDTLIAGTTDDLVQESRDADFVLTNAALHIGGTETDSLSGFTRVFLIGGPSANRLDASAWTLGGVLMDGREGDDVLIGSSRGDAMVGGSGHDQFTGGAGNDIMGGGAGNDQYFFLLAQPQGADSVVELTGEGFDSLRGLPPASVNLGLTSPQIISPNLTLTLTSLGVENATP